MAGLTSTSFAESPLMVAVEMAEAVVMPSLSSKDAYNRPQYSTAADQAKSKAPSPSSSKNCARQGRRTSQMY